MLWVIVAVIAVLVVVGVVLARQGAARARERVESRLRAMTVVRQSKANYRGTASGGTGQTGGAGVLALSPDELVFVQFVPDHEIRIARREITSVTSTTAFEGSEGKEVLVVTWSDDRAAWQVPDIAGWRAALTA